jgi:hypothetical protein
VIQARALLLLLAEGHHDERDSADTQAALRGIAALLGLAGAKIDQAQGELNGSRPDIPEEVPDIAPSE